jgi:hypothetical protein
MFFEFLAPGFKNVGDLMITPEMMRDHGTPAGASGFSCALPCGVAAQCSQEVGFAERGPVGVAEVQL